MPLGPNPLGFVYFVGVKFVGYSGYAYAINRTESVALSTLDKPSPWWEGCVRTGIGVVVGALVGVGCWGLARHVPVIGKYATGIFFCLLLPVRVLEWLLLLRLLYRKFQLNTRRKAVLITGGILVSFALDLIGMMAMFVIPGGAWVC